MALTKEEVQKIARLAKLTLTPDEETRYGKELSAMIQFVDKLNELKLEGVPADSPGANSGNVFREDVSIQSQVLEGALKSAPASEDGLFVVPRVI